MKGIKIKCPNCKQICFETTESFNPNVTPIGGNVRPLITESFLKTLGG
jgi:hypothetical protein